MDLYHHGRSIEARPYQLGLALWPGETVWGETWARCSLDRHPSGLGGPGQLPLSCWGVTSKRLIGRLFSGLYTGWAWEQIGAYRASLASGKEWAEVAVEGRPTAFYGPGVAPLAVALAWHTHGAAALLEHPGLAPLQVQPKPRRGEQPMLALPAHDPLADLLREL